MAASDCAVLLAAAGRAAGGASNHRRSARSCRHGAAVCGKYRQFHIEPNSRARRRFHHRLCVGGTYSVLSRRLKSVPTDAVAGFCAVTELLAALVHTLVETMVWPDSALQWAAIIALGIGPVGAAFYAWDIGMKRGDIRVLGAASYATPLLSTAFLILAGFAKASANIALAAVLIAGGGLIAAKDMFLRR